LSSLTKYHSSTTEFDLDEVVAIQIISRLKRKVYANAHGPGTEHRIADVPSAYHRVLQPFTPTTHVIPIRAVKSPGEIILGEMFA
jgi:hypothetical protein